ncbi:MAG: hypothetical protein ABSF51_12735 [Verrucomicrobiota bacterium]|jgi:hypothetical protein
MNFLKFVTLKEIAAALEISPDTLRRRLADFGLDQCRDATSKKPIRFHRAAAMRELAKKGFNVTL